MMTNRNFGKLVDGAVTYAPVNLVYGGALHSNPSAEAYLSAGWKRVTDTAPNAQDGVSVRPTGWAETDAEITRTYETYTPDPAPILISKAKVAATVDEMGKTAAFFAWIMSKAQYATAWFDGSATLAYDPTANGGDLASLFAALELPTDQIAAIVASVTEEA